MASDNGNLPVRRPETIQAKSITELMQLSEILFKGIGSSMGFDKPEKVFAVILCGMEVGLSPTQALASIMLLGGKPAIYGDAALALVRASVVFEKIDETIHGEGEDRYAVCKVTRKGESEKTFTFSMADARQAGLIEKAKGKKGDSLGNWIAYPQRMLMFRARGFALRDVFPDVLRGLITYEEAQDTIQTAEVKVVSTTMDQPKPATTATSTEQTATVPPTTQSLDGPVTPDQLKEIGSLRERVMAAKAISDPLAQKAEWEQVLSPFGVSSAKSFTISQAAKFIDSVGKQHDPFNHPTSTPSPVT